jgi:hypothetical protein
MSITPSPPGQAKGERFEHGSVLGGKTRAARVSSQWKSTIEGFVGRFWRRIVALGEVGLALDRFHNRILAGSNFTDYAYPQEPS